MAKQACSESGFSLVEVITALFIVALIASSGAAIIMQMVSSRESLESLSERLDKVHQAHAFMRDDLAQWMARDFRPRDDIDLPVRFLGGSATEVGHVMSFVRDGWLNPGYEAPRSGLTVVRYFVDGDRLIRRIRLAPDGVNSTEEIEQTLISGIRDYQISFRQQRNWVPVWLARQSDNAGAPIAVRFTFELEDGRRYDWKFLTPVAGAARS